MHDPIEDSEEFRDIIAAARAEVESTARSRGAASQRGTGGSIEAELARMLREQHKITWFSRRQMNPAIVFD